MISILFSFPASFYLLILLVIVFNPQWSSFSFWPSQALFGLGTLSNCYSFMTWIRASNVNSWLCLSLSHLKVFCLWKGLSIPTFFEGCILSPCPSLLLPHPVYFSYRIAQNLSSSSLLFYNSPTRKSRPKWAATKSFVFFMACLLLVSLIAVTDA